MDKLEKEWFELVSGLVPQRLGAHGSSISSNEFLNLLLTFPSRTQSAQSAMMEREKTRMRSSFVMAAIWRFIKIVMVYLISLRGSGCVESVLFPQKIQ